MFRKIRVSKGLSGSGAWQMAQKNIVQVTFVRWRGDSKIVEANAEHDFVLRGSSECFVQCSASNFYSRTAFPNWRSPVCRRGKKAAPSASESPSAGLPRKIFYLPETLQTRINRPFLRNLHILRGALMFYPCQIAVY